MRLRRLMYFEERPVAVAPCRNRIAHGRLQPYVAYHHAAQVEVFAHAVDLQNAAGRYEGKRPFAVFALDEIDRKAYSSFPYEPHAAVFHYVRSVWLQYVLQCLVPFAKHCQALCQ